MSSLHDGRNGGSDMVVGTGGLMDAKEPVVEIHIIQCTKKNNNKITAFKRNIK